MTGFTYKSYSFVDKDPVIDEVRTIYQASGVNYKWLSEQSSVSISTIRNMFEGKTKRPQSATTEAILRSMGYKRVIVPFGEIVQIEPPMPQPRSATRHVVNMAKYRNKKAKRA